MTKRWENGSPLAAPRLASFGLPEAALVPLSPGELADGPWCPDDTAPNRYDADLFRIRSVLVTVRLESALDALRGPAGVLFSRAGTARAADRYAPDVTLRARVTPANLMGRR